MKRLCSRERQKNDSRRGFTLVELLAVIVILGILIVIGINGVSSLISKSKDTKQSQNEKNVSIAAESYLQANSSEKPKSIGEYVDISVSDLKDANYLKDDIENADGESCMKNSIIRVYKYSKSEYSYTAYLYCGDEKVPSEITPPKPTIKVSFSNSNDVNDAKFKIELSGGKTSGGSEIALDGYYFSISTKKTEDDEYVEMYNSGTLSANKNTTLVIEKKISDYVDLTGETYVSIKVIATNVSGGKTEKNIADKDSSFEGKYNDNVKPDCGTDISGAAKDESDWINKNSIKKVTNNSRTISIDCNDGNGSGCLRNSFTKTWPNDTTKNAEYSYITIQDNNGNTTDCRVRVNVDSEAPSISVKAYKADENGAAANSNNILSSAVKVTDSDSSKTINTTDYANNYNGWLNNNNYPYGVIYSIDVSDNLHLYRWTWKTNNGYINDAKNVAYTNFSTSNPDGTSGYFDNSKIDFTTSDNGLTSSKINIGFSTEGMRAGVLTVYDRAGNSTEITIYANIDRTAPPVPTIASVKTDKKKYTSGTWTNQAVTIVLDENVSRADNLSTGGTTISGWSKFVYEVKKHGETTASITGNSSSYKFNNSNSFEGKNQIVWKSCDNANNCSNYTDAINVYIDVTRPSCNVTASNDSSSNTWTNSAVTVTATCSDSGNSVTDKNSGCATEPFSSTYDTNISTTVAGANGNNKGGTVYDIAGNSTNCAANKTVKVDVEAPQCYYSSGNNKWTNQAVTVKWGCNEKGSNMSSAQSGCKSSDGTHTVNEDNKVTLTYDIGSFTIMDNAGNSTKCAAHSFSIKQDKIAPSCTKTGDNSNWKNSDVTVTWGCSDSDSGCTTPSKDNSLTTTEKTWTKSKKFTSTTKTWNNSQYIIKDNAGNSTTCVAQTRNIYVDKTPPSCTSSGDKTKWTNSDVTITWGCSDSDSGCSTPSNNNSLTTTSTTWTKSKTFSSTIKEWNNEAYDIKDNAGNTNNCAIKTRKIYLDKTKPSVKCKVTKSGITITNGPNESDSGVKSTKYAFKVNPSSAPGESSSKWGSNTPISACGKSNVKGYVKVKDNAGNVTIETCDGSYDTESCCSVSNYKKCDYVTACRKGITNIHKTASLSDYKGVACHMKVPSSFWGDNGGSCDESTKLYLVNGGISSGDFTYVCYDGGQGGSRVSPSSGKTCGYIKNNCINSGDLNKTCRYSACPG